MSSTGLGLDHEIRVLINIAAFHTLNWGAKYKIHVYSSRHCNCRCICCSNSYAIYLQRQSYLPKML